MPCMKRNWARCSPVITTHIVKPLCQTACSHPPTHSTLAHSTTPRREQLALLALPSLALAVVPRALDFVRISTMVTMRSISGAASGRAFQSNARLVCGQVGALCGAWGW